MTTGPEAEWRAALSEGRILLQRDTATGEHIFPPRVAIDRSVEWVEASGGGTVYSVTTVRAKPPAPSTNVSLIDLDEGVRMMGRVEGLEPDDVTIGQRVRARIGEGEDGPVILFDPA